jgi:hypothetical protein
MNNLLKIAALTLTTTVLLSGCHADVSKKTVTTVVDTVKNGNEITRDSTWQSGTTVNTTHTTTTTSITVDPVTNDSTIITKTVIKHSKK